MKLEINSKPLGYVNFDDHSSDNTEVEMRIPKNRVDEISRGQYVRIESSFNDTTRNFFARISRGPFFVPDAVSKDSAYARAAILQADTVRFRPDFHAVCYAQVAAELNLNIMRTVSSFTRPNPQSAVYSLSGRDIEKFLELEGDMFLGELYGYQDVKIRIPSNKNAALPRNIGIFGTVGSGKTNTGQVLIEEAAAAGWSVIILDKEGEYISMDNPSTQRSLNEAFIHFGIQPSGLQNLQTYHVVNTEPSLEEGFSQAFSVRFSNIHPEILAEILELSEAQNEIFLELYSDIRSRNARARNNRPRNRGGLVAHLVDQDDNSVLGVTIQDIIDDIDSILLNGQQPPPGGRRSYQVLRRKLRKIERYGIFDSPDTRSLGDYSELLEGSRVNVIDLSGLNSNILNNIVITDLLRSIFDLKLSSSNLPPVLIIIEEAHSYISKESASRMEETLDILKEISRRGRKRWISLCFISQEPSHLPAEIYDLCNTKFVHQIIGGKNLDTLKVSTGAVDSAIWEDVPRLSQGTALFISSYFKNRPMFVNMRPSMSERRHVEE